MERNRWLQALIIFLVFISGFFLAGMVWQIGIRFSDVILPFFLAWLLAFTLNPLADLLMQSRRLNRPLAISLVYLTLLLAILLAGLLVLPPFFAQTVQLGRQFPAFAQELPGILDGWQRFLDDRGVNLRLNTLLTEGAIVQRAEALGTSLATNALGLAQGIASAVLNTVIVLILSFYFMLDGEKFSRLFVEVLPERWKSEAEYLLASVDRTFGGFMRGMLIQAVVYGVGTGLIMWGAGLNYVLVVSVFAGFIMVIPFVGSIVALVPPLILAAFTGEWVRVVVVFVALMLLQQLVINIIAPKIMSDSVGMHPLLIFAAVLLGAKELGIWGAIFGVPVVGVVWSMVVLLYRERRRRSRHSRAAAGSVVVSSAVAEGGNE